MYSPQPSCSVTLLLLWFAMLVRWLDYLVLYEDRRGQAYAQKCTGFICLVFLRQACASFLTALTLHNKVSVKIYLYPRVVCTPLIEGVKCYRS